MHAYLCLSMWRLVHNDDLRCISYRSWIAELVEDKVRIWLSCSQIRRHCPAY